MREKAGNAVPDKIKDMVENHDNEMHAEVCSQPQRCACICKLVIECHPARSSWNC